MKYSILFLLAGIITLLVSCGGDDLTSHKPAAVFQTLPGNPENCIIYIPYRYSEFGGSVSGSITAAQVPGASASVKGNKNWGFVSYIGKCGEPSTWQHVNTPGSETAKPAPSPGDKAKKEDEAKSIAAKANQVGVALVGATGKGSSAEPLIAETAEFYATLNKYAGLKPYAGNTTPASKLISALEKASGQAPTARRAGTARANATAGGPASISSEADRLVQRLTSLQ
jgi:hypothetical protein